MTNSLPAVRRTGMKVRRGLDLRAEIRWGAEQEPFFAIRADGNLRLGAGFACEPSSADRLAVGAGAIPLRKSATRSRSENLDVHGSSVASGVACIASGRS